MTAGLGPTGFIPKTLDEIITELQTAYRANFGDNIDVDERSPYGLQIAIAADREAAVWAVAQAVYDAFDPDNAEDEQLDKLCRMTGTIRLGAAYSRMIVRCGGTNGTVLPQGRVVSVSGTGVRFASVAEATIPPLGHVDVVFQAEETGPKVALAGTLTIETPVAGWDTAANSSDATLGRDIESNADLRLRREVEMRTAANAATEAIRTAVSQLHDDVNAVVVFDNSTDLTDADGLPPHSVEVVVDLAVGADAEAVRAAVFGSVAAGIRTYGGNSGTVTDGTGRNHTVAFSEADPVNIYETCTLTVDANEYPADGNDQVAAALFAYGDTYSMGKDVKSSRQVMALKDIPGIIDADVRVGTSASPTGTSVSISLRQRAKFDSSRITVTSAAGTP